jgi:hypothetical protein
MAQQLINLCTKPYASTTVHAWLLQQDYNALHYRTSGDLAATEVSSFKRAINIHATGTDAVKVNASKSAEGSIFIYSQIVKSTFVRYVLFQLIQSNR